MLGRQIAALSHPPSSVKELKRALQEAWNHLSPKTHTSSHSKYGKSLSSVPGCQRQPCSIQLQSSFLVHGTTSKGGVDGWASSAAHVMGATITNVLQPGAFVRFDKTHGSLKKRTSGLRRSPQCHIKKVFDDVDWESVGVPQSTERHVGDWLLRGNP
ncbi:hypothetical protein TNCV_4139411 [Trichonephila clavipes]|nr:hypothetical protein TNCV_4139411 [Trichonephila clavipes]